MSSTNSSGPPRRPPLLARHSSSSTHVRIASSPSLSSSQQRPSVRPSQRHVSHASKLAARVPSFGNNINKLAKIADAAGMLDARDSKTSIYRPSHVKRNSSNLNLTKSGNLATALRPNKSETALHGKRNRSSGQLAKLPRNASSKKLSAKGHKRDPRGTKGAASREIEEDAHDVVNATVRFDLGKEEEQENEWTEESASQSPATSRANTTHNSLVLDQNNRDSMSPYPKRPTSSSGRYNPRSNLTPITPPTPDSPMRGTSGNASPANGKPGKPQGEGRPPDADHITSRLLQRNVSFTVPPKLTSVSATASDTHAVRPTLTTQDSNRTNTTDGSDHQEAVVSRFINAGSASGTPHESSFLPHRDQDDEPAPHPQSHPRSHPGHEAMDSKRMPSRSNSTITDTSTTVTYRGSASGISTPSLPRSRTQQKLDLSRASSRLEAQQQAQIQQSQSFSGQYLHPLQFLRNAGGSGRLQPHFGAMYASGTKDSMGSGSLPGAGAIPERQLRQLFDQADTEYRRIRIFQNPLADGISRLSRAGALRDPTAGPPLHAGEFSRSKSTSKASSVRRAQPPLRNPSAAQASASASASTVTTPTGRPSGETRREPSGKVGLLSGGASLAPSMQAHHTPQSSLRGRVADRSAGHDTSGASTTANTTFNSGNSAATTPNEPAPPPKRTDSRSPSGQQPPALQKRAVTFQGIEGRSFAAAGPVAGAGLAAGSPPTTAKRGSSPVVGGRLPEDEQTQSVADVKEQAKEACRRLWERRVVAAGE